MRVGIIGSGTVGQHLGAGFVKHGHEVWIGTRDPAKLADWAKKAGPKVHVVSTAEAAKQGELLVVASRWDGTEAALRAAGPENFRGKVVMDATNPLRSSENGPPTLALGFDTSAGEKVQGWLPGAKVVKVYNTVGAPLMVDPTFQGGLKGDMFIAGDDAQAKATVADVVRDFGWEVVDAGDIRMSRVLEPLCILWVHVGLSTGKWNHAYKLIRT
ncbi:MAG TPA: NAD(P)-binding domain-containing protein [Myxococcaceae bacterium]|nr:NAD(P)-binding domain-containing protein [Myxococcaceae bacterium]